MTIAMLAVPRVQPRLVDPAVFVERMISRDPLERADVPQDDLLGLHNPQTGETLFVQGAGFRRWMIARS